MTDLYRGEWTPTAKRDIVPLPEEVATVAVGFIFGAPRDNPHRAGSHPARR